VTAPPPVCGCHSAPTGPRLGAGSRLAAARAGKKERGCPRSLTLMLTRSCASFVVGYLAALMEMCIQCPEALPPMNRQAGHRTAKECET